MRRHALSGFTGISRSGLAALAIAGALAGAAPSALAQPQPEKGAEAAGAGAPAAAASSGTTGATPGAASAASPAAPAGAPSPAASGSTAEGAPAVPIPEKPAMDGATYSVRLRDLEQRVDELKDQIRRSHTRLALLSDTILSGGAAGSRAEVLFRNEMSSAFRLTRALFVVDGAVQYNRQDESGALADQKEVPIFNGSIPPGDHTVQVILNFQGNGYGVFTYLRGYKFEVKSAHSFTAVEGKTLALTATALEKGGVTTPLEQRPTVEWSERIASLGPGGAGATQGAPAPRATTPGAGASGSFQVGGGK